MGIKAKGILGSLPILASAFGQREGIKVVIRAGERPRTHGKTIYLPELPIEADEELETKAFGFLYHEAGHVEFTDMASFQQASDKFEAGLLNAVEDVRMENMRNATYPGSAATLAKLVGVLATEGWFSTPEKVGQAEPQQVLHGAVLTYLRGTVLDQPCKEIGAHWWAKAKAMLGDAASLKLEVLLNEVVNLDSTSEALQLARRIKTLVEETANEQEEPNEPESNESPEGGEGDDGDEGGAGEPGQDDGNGQGNGQGSDQSGDQGDGTDSQGSASSTDGGGPKGDAKQAGGNGPDRNALKEALAGNGAGDAMRTDLGDMAAESLNQGAQESVRQAGSSGSVSHDLSVVKPAASGHGELDKVRAQSQQLRTRLAAQMEARAREKQVHRRQGNRLDGRVVHRLFVGDTRVFAKREHKRKVNTAVQILLDCSGSMGGGKIVTARQAALAAALGIAQIPGCKVAAAAFPDIVLLKGFDETARGAAGRFLIQANGGTPMGEAMVWAAGQLAVRREDRKMLVVITDGEPNDSKLVQTLVRKYRQSAVEVVGIGIATDAVKRLFPASVVIQSVDDLAAALFSVVKERLRRVA